MIGLYPSSKDINPFAKRKKQQEEKTKRFYPKRYKPAMPPLLEKALEKVGAKAQRAVVAKWAKRIKKMAPRPEKTMVVSPARPLSNKKIVTDGWPEFVKSRYKAALASGTLREWKLQFPLYAKQLGMKTTAQSFSK